MASYLNDDASSSSGGLPRAQEYQGRPNCTPVHLPAAKLTVRHVRQEMICAKSARHLQGRKQQPELGERIVPAREHASCCG